MVTDATAVGTHRSASKPRRRIGLFVGRRDFVAVAGLTLVVLGLGLFRSNTTSLWTDELFTVTLAGKPLSEVIRQLWSSEANMSLYYVLMALWLHGLDRVGIAATESIVRVPSIIFAAGAVAFAYLIGKRLFTFATGLLGALLLALNYVFLMEVAQARAYSLELLLQLIGWYLLIQVIQRTTRNDRVTVTYAIIMALSIYASLFSVLIAAAQLVAFILIGLASATPTRVARDAIRPLLIAAPILAVLVAPLALDVAVHGSPNDWIPTPGLGEVLRFAGAITGANPLFAIVLAFGAVLGLAMLVRQRRAIPSDGFGQKAAVILLATWMVVPLALSWGLSRPPSNLHMFLTRYLLPIVPPICILSAAGICSIANVRVRRVSIAALVLLATSAVPVYYSRVQREDFRTALSWLVQRYQSGDGVVCASLGCPYAMQYYAAGKLEAASPGKDVWGSGNFATASVDPGSLESYAKTHDRLFFVYGTAGQSSNIGVDEDWLRANYRLVGKIETEHGSAGTVTVELFATG